MTKQRIISMPSLSILALFLMEYQENKTFNPTALQPIFSFRVSKSVRNRIVEDPSNTVCMRTALLAKASVGLDLLV
jgi:hypothetical protein